MRPFVENKEEMNMDLGLGIKAGGEQLYFKKSALQEKLSATGQSIQG